ncbi:MAG: type IV pilus modification protein PilV [Lysobacter sp.]
MSLVEVLVSVLVLGLGLLGLAMLQVTNLRLTQSSNARTVATNLASMLLDDMRNNRLIAIGYAGTHTASSAAEDCTPNSAAATPVAQTTSFACSMRRALGAGARAQVAVNDATGVVSIAIEWGDAQRWNATGPTTRFVLETRL